MEGFSKILYKDKEIFYVDYSSFGLDVYKTLRLIRYATEEYERLQLPPKSVLAIANLSGLHFDTDLVNAFREEKEKTAYYEKKVAVIGLKGLQRIAYSYVVSINSKDFLRIFRNITEAKEWLIRDKF
ncbi:MAG: hypothetical protein GXY86_04415 [Firmicutes bacterium]|nr:hypothetical protein [Bacillota bacterium]